MVETAIADIVRSTVATDNPLRALNEIVVESLKLLAYLAASLCTSGNHRFEDFSETLCLICVVLLLNPFLSCSLVFCRCAFRSDYLLEEECYTLLHLLVTHYHTETKFTEILEE